MQRTLRYPELPAYGGQGLKTPPNCMLLLQCRSLIQRDWSQEGSTSNKMRMHAMILLLLFTSMNDDADDDSSSVSIPNTLLRY